MCDARDEEIRLDDSPTTEDVKTSPPTAPVQPERIGSVMLTQKVSELRQKLDQKAKQERAYGLTPDATCLRFFKSKVSPAHAFR